MSDPRPPMGIQQMEEFHVIFDGPPAHESGRFVEVENERGESIAFGEWAGPDEHEFWHLVYSLRCAIHERPFVLTRINEFYCPDCLKAKRRKMPSPTENQLAALAIVCGTIILVALIAGATITGKGW